MSYIDNAIDSLYNSVSVNCLFLAIAVCELSISCLYNSKITVYKLSVIVLQTVCNFTDSLNLSSRSLSSISLKLPITISYRQLTHHHCTCPKTRRLSLFQKVEDDDYVRLSFR
jgi:hypothetical protein